MQKYCHSCSAPLSSPEFKGIAENYCKYCTDENGVLRPKRVIQSSIAEWFKSWQPGIDDQKAMDRAELFMKALPEWAEE